MMSVSRVLAAVCVAVLSGMSGGAWGQTVKSVGGGASIKGLPPPGLSAWSVFSCITPFQGYVCVVPVHVKVTGTECHFNIAHVIEFDPSGPRPTRRIRWELNSIDPARGRLFRFVRSADPDKTGISFLQNSVGERTFDDDLKDDDESTPLLGHRFGKRLKASAGPDDATLFLYSVRVEWRDPGNAWQTCTNDPPGPAIINRGR
jgi:hypothetical protein